MILTDNTLHLGPIGGSGLGPFSTIGSSNNGSAGITGVADLVSSVIGILTVVASVWFLLNILFGGYEWMSAGGDSKKIGEARDHITHAFIGLVIVVGAWALTATAGQFFGFSILDPAKLFGTLPINGK